MRSLIVEDDAALAAQLSQAMAESGFAVDIAADGGEGEFLGATNPYDVAILDLGLPGVDGVEILRRWRSEGRDFAVLVLTARASWSDKAKAFKAGADDYVTKPFQMEEVVVRCRSILRRAAGHATPAIEIGALRLDSQMGLFTLDEMPLRLTAFEARILGYMMHHGGRVVSRSELSDHVYDDRTERDFASLEVVIGRLRKKIGRDRIETIRNEGYRLSAP
ncbi:DNA-binding response regulator [Fulvimarina endophytica]|uniref:DNA-binding response regulator n=1 Tax=Fulvimarina endophytica TaxID=2293836 RepID=A0A371X4L3_9HYPH|nr:response regulator transcription factor [Fulvimarina endophytica]RFC64139.1 DNA-binding response regulator [Fulvimarina endophytica]